MDLNNTSANLDDMHNTRENFKQVNNERMDQIEEKGSTDPLTEENLDKLNKALDSHSSKLARIEASMQRSGMEVKSYSFEDNGFDTYNKAFSSYLRKGAESGLGNTQPVDTVAPIGGSIDNGGYTVTQNMHSMIAANIENHSVMRKICSVQQISFMSLDIIDDSDTMTSQWVGDGSPVGDVGDGNVSRKTINAHELVAQPKATQRLVEDESIDIEMWLADRLAELFGNTEESAFINGGGDSSNQPMGILSYPSGNNVSSIERIQATAATTGTMIADDIFNLFYSLDGRYSSKASFLMSRSALHQARKIKDDNDNYLWHMSLTTGDDTLLGIPVYQSHAMPSPTAGSESVIIGDFSRYQIADRTAVKLLRDPYTAKPYIRFYATKCVGGNVIRTAGFKILKMSL